ncbi:nucleotidyltransferase domain-containing protein [bacterium]|nr:nucleotidyltransferase domain-containing protein [bacterium]
MTKFGLENRHLDFIKNTLNKYFKDFDACFYIFGSRSKGSFKEYSDVDIAIDNHNLKIDDHTISKIALEFENSTFPYEVDIVDLNAISDKFKSLIKDDLKRIY